MKYKENVVTRLENLENTMKVLKLNIDRREPDDVIDQIYRRLVEDIQNVREIVQLEDSSY
jgi:hypothetical protein